MQYSINSNPKKKSYPEITLADYKKEFELKQLPLMQTVYFIIIIETYKQQCTIRKKVKQNSDEKEQAQSKFVNGQVSQTTSYLLKYSTSKKQNNSMPYTSQFQGKQINVKQQQQKNGESQKLDINNLNVYQRSNQVKPSQKEYQQKQQIVIEQQEIIKNIKIRYHQDEERQTQVAKILRDLLKASSGKRAVDIQLRPYLRDRLNFQEMSQNYNLNLPSKKEIKKICNGMIVARGDGNCFYTAFGYQFLNILICQYSNEEYDNFIDEIEKLKLNLIIQHPDFQEYDQETGKELLNEFLFRIQNLRMIGNNQERENQLFNQFQEYEIGNKGKGCLSVLSTIFFRNLSNLVLDSSELKDQVFDRVNLLIWEQECNNNEIIIQCLAQFCQITVVLLYMENQTFVENRYNDGKQKQIILLIRPGHYNIGIFEQQNQF